MADRYVDIADFVERNPQFREAWIAEHELGGMDPARFSKLKSRKYDVKPSEEEIPLIAALLNQSPSYVRKLYPRKAAA